MILLFKIERRNIVEEKKMILHENETYHPTGGSD